MSSHSDLPRLGVNIDHVATLRQLRGTPYPDLLAAAQMVERSGGQQITVHLREDRRHIQDRDVELLRERLKVPLNLEMAVSPEILRFATRVKPARACLVPEKRKEVTTEGGLDLKKNFRVLDKTLKTLKKAGIAVSLFIEPEIRWVKLSRDLGAYAVEFHTGKYCRATQGAFGKRSAGVAKSELTRLKEAALSAIEHGIEPHAGHGLDYENVRPVVDLRNSSGKFLIHEYNIGHSIVCRAALVGMERAVREMVSAIVAP
jgi:pyridoxine 5-phosphate synthase